jgi:hypothetical protein
VHETAKEGPPDECLSEGVVKCFSTKMKPNIR